MKMNKLFTIGAIAVLTAFAIFGFTACGDDPPKTYTVTFDSNGGSAVSSITGLSSGDTITEPTPPTKTGTIVNVFKGWYKEAGLTNAWDFASSTVTSNITLYAKWDFEYALGDTGPGGGKIFYRSETGFTMTDDNSTAHYLEAAPADMTSTLRWASPAFIPGEKGGSDNGNWVDITGTETAIGTGRKNTTIVLATDTEAPAAKACNEYTNNGKTDWFLPSKDELWELHENRASVDNLKTSGLYWSSSQSNNIEAWSYPISNQGSASKDGWSDTKHDWCAVRAVRAF